MLTSFVLTMALAAPVPTPAAPVASGPLPRILELKADSGGKIMITVTRTEMVKVGGGAIAVAPGGAGAQPAPPVAREVPVTRMAVVELSDVKDLKITTADGTKVETADAIKKLAGGAVVVVSADGKPVSPNFLKVFKDDVLVLASPELTGAANGPGVITRPGFRPLPAPIPAPIAVPAQPGIIQIQIQPAIQLVPAQPVPAPAPPAPKPEK